jgi:peptidyl-dipeptidase Dcp
MMFLRNTLKRIHYLLFAGIFFTIACSDKNQINMSNPLLIPFNNPHQAVPFDKIKPEHFIPAFDSVFIETRNKINRIIENNGHPDFKNTIIALERANNRLTLLKGILYNLNYAETSKEIQEVTKEISPRLTDFGNDILLNEQLFDKVRVVYRETDRTQLDPEDARLLEKTYKDFERNGASLSDSEKVKYRKITRELSRLSVQFDENVLAETNNFFLQIKNKSDLSGLPENVLATAEEEAKTRKLDGWVFTLQFPSYMPFMKYADNRNLRKKMYMAFNTRGLHNNEYDNKEIVKQIVQLRLEESHLLGYNSYADFVLCERMAESTDKVETFMNDLLVASLPTAKKEYKEVQQFASSLGANFVIEAWDWSYYTEKLKKQKYDIDDEMTRPYFQLEKVENGVLGLANTLYGLTFKENPLIPVYNKDVKVFEVFDETNRFLSLLYLDYFPRAGKKGGAWMTEYKLQYISDDSIDHRPQVSLVFNFTKPTEKKPSLLTFNEVSTLLHEFGHALHGMLSQCKYEEISGTSVYQDFVELPSQIMENWAEQQEWLDKIAVHFETDDKIPDEMVQKIIDSKNFITGYLFLRQLSFGMLDMKWHTLTEPFNGDVIEFEEEAMAPAQILPKVAGTGMSTSFSHIFSGGYAAGYYSYKWAEVLDADAFALFREQGIFNKNVAKSFRDNILTKGGTEHPMDLYVRFRGKEPTIQALLERSGLK